ncbi:MAG: hypothetical protein Ct9H90mP27_7450 [Gammaproteobacteria bacterium]|nr:MAG: hypothetical protein Ct9H90mP27_7450 [Gammaproteobacteria bacterium]
MTSIQFGEYGEQVLKNMRRSISLFQSSGTNVIIDDLLFKRAYLDDYVAVLDPARTWFVGVKCSLEIVKAREAKRPGRFPGQQLLIMNRFMNMAKVMTWRLIQAQQGKTGRQKIYRGL